MVETVPIRPRLVLLGFPKSGTHSVWRAVNSTGLRALHCARDGRRELGREIVETWHQTNDPLAACAGFDALTEYTVTRDAPDESYWPMLNMEWVRAVSDRYPETVLVLNTRCPLDWVSSVMRWHNDYYGRITRADLPGLPPGDRDLLNWLEWHYRRIVFVLRDRPRFVVMPIESELCPNIIASALRRPVQWWGRANENPEAST